MTESEHDARLLAELEVMRGIKKASTIFQFEFAGDPPDIYTITFRGKGPIRSDSLKDVEVAERHECEIRLPSMFPESPPDVRWLSSIFHPNISNSGFINLKEVGLRWEEDMTLDIVCERLWDLARMSFFDLDSAANYAARKYFANDNTYRLPFDHRILRDKSMPQGANVIHYERREDHKLSLPKSTHQKDLFFIGEETTPPVPPIQPQLDDQPATHDDDIFYIE